MNLTLILISLSFIHSVAHGNNGEFITSNHRWAEDAKAVVPLYIGVREFNRK